MFRLPVSRKLLNVVKKGQAVNMGFLESFWSESFWLTPGHTWDELKNKPGDDIYLPQLEDLLWSLPLGVLLLVFRYVFEKYLVTPVGYWLGVKKKTRPVLTENPVLEKMFLQYGKEANNNLESIAKQTDLSVREMQRWLRDREMLSKPEPIQKFKECVWHFLFYITSFTYGLVVLWNKPWFWKTLYCWKDWPRLGVSYDIYMYYLVELSFYWCLVFTTLSDHKRKDFYQMLIHHVATIGLMLFSWPINYVRIGTLVLLCHDAADFPMAAAKIMKYLGHQTMCIFFLWVFIIVWILTRLVYFPAVLLYSSLVELYEVMEVSHAQRLLQGLLIVLQILHLIWTYMIAKIAMQHVTSGETNDIRSDSEED